MRWSFFPVLQKGHFAGRPLFLPVVVFAVAVFAGLPLLLLVGVADRLLFSALAARTAAPQRRPLLPPGVGDDGEGGT